MRLKDQMGEPQAVECLLHEWGHALARSFSLERLSKLPGLDPAEFDRACHDEAWGLSLSVGYGGHTPEEVCESVSSEVIIFDVPR